ncbi:MAG: hypothetical protein M1819_003674 [Sarea resinae]|nr:MAG: hypothetical protein M1819_003674 [Sarea resinae]
MAKDHEDFIMRRANNSGPSTPLCPNDLHDDFRHVSPRRFWLPELLNHQQQSRLSRRPVRRLLATVCVLAAFWMFNIYLNYHYGTPSCLRFPVGFVYNASTASSNAFKAPEPLAYRIPDTIDTFENYQYRSTCNLSSLDLHTPFAPLCTSRKAMLTAMSSGGRIGHDAPYMPRGCDMRWFSTEEVCDILGRFEKVIVVGDSMMRHVIGSINVLLRKDLGYGAVTDWNFSPEERKECFCNKQFNVKACSVQGIFKTSDVAKNDPDSVACKPGTVDVMIEQMIRFPIPSEEIDRFKAQIGTSKPRKPYAFVFGHGLWNIAPEIYHRQDLDLQSTLNWLDQILASTTSQLPYLSQPGSFWPRLILTPNAAGRAKPDEWLVSQGNKALMLFEEAVAVEATKRGVEHLGTWNMSIQANMYDGV